MDDIILKILAVGILICAVIVGTCAMVVWDTTNKRRR